MAEDALYMRVVFYLCDKIMKNDILPKTKIDLAHLAFETGVSKHVVSKAFEYLLEEQILQLINSEFYLTDIARKQAVSIRKNAILNSELKTLFELMNLYNISMAEVEAAYNNHSGRSL